MNPQKAIPKPRYRCGDEIVLTQGPKADKGKLYIIHRVIIWEGEDKPWRHVYDIRRAGGSQVKRGLKEELLMIPAEWELTTNTKGVS